MSRRFRQRFYIAAALLGAACTTLTGPLSPQARIDAATAGGVIDLTPGTWTGDIVITRPITLRGAGRERTFITGHRAIIVRSAGVILKNLTIRGSEVALSIEGTGTVARVEEVDVVCDGNAPAGVRVDGAHFSAMDVSMSGPCRRSVELTNSDADLARMSVKGSREAGIHSVDSRVQLRTVTVSLIQDGAAALFEAGSRLDVHDLKTSGGEDGVLLRSGNTNIDGLEVTGSGITGYAAVQGTHVLAHARFDGPFREAALSVLNGAALKATATEVTHAGRAGLLAIHAHVDIDSMQVDGTRKDKDGDFGHSFLLQRSQGTLRSLRATHAEGAAIYASGREADISIDGCDADEVATGATAVLRAHLDISGLHVSNAALGVMANEEGSVAIRDSSLRTRTGVLACEGSKVAEGSGVEIKADSPRRSCTGDAFEPASLPARRE